MKVTIWEYLITMMLTTGEYLILTIFLGILLFLTCRPVHEKVWEYVTVVAHKLESAIWWYNDILLSEKYLYFFYVSVLYIFYLWFLIFDFIYAMVVAPQLWFCYRCLASWSITNKLTQSISRCFGFHYWT